MPSFDNTWLYNNNLPFPTIVTLATHDGILLLPPDHPSGAEKICGLCSVPFAKDDSHTRPSSCDDLSCPECTWIWRHGEGVCWDCVVGFVCSCLEGNGKGEEGEDMLEGDGVDGDDEGYDGDDEREGA